MSEDERLAEYHFSVPKHNTFWLDDSNSHPASEISTFYKITPTWHYLIKRNCDYRIPRVHISKWTKLINQHLQVLFLDRNWSNENSRQRLDFGHSSMPKTGKQVFSKKSGKGEFSSMTSRHQSSSEQSDERSKAIILFILFRLNSGKSLLSWSQVLRNKLAESHELQVLPNFGERKPFRRARDMIWWTVIKRYPDTLLNCFNLSPDYWVATKITWTNKTQTVSRIFKKVVQKRPIVKVS